MNCNRDVEMHTRHACASKGFKDSNEYKKGIEFLDKEYGEKNVQKFLKTYKAETN